jgi:hypothetical protein
LCGGPQFRYELANPPYLRAVGATGSIEGKTVREVIRDLDQAVLDVLDGVYTTGQRFVGNEFPITADWQGDGRPYRGTSTWCTNPCVIRSKR